MTNGANNTAPTRADFLWKSADTLRGQIDAAEYKHFVLGLLFLKYIADSLRRADARRDELKVELEAHGGQTNNISIFGQESNPTTWRLAHMNRGIEANLGSQPADSLLCDLHPDMKADYVLANPPFNISDRGGERLAGDKRWHCGAFQHSSDHRIFPGPHAGVLNGR